MIKKALDSVLVKERLLALYTRLEDGRGICKKEEAERYGISSRSVQRDLDTLRAFIAGRNAESGMRQELLYDRSCKTYKLVPPQRQMLGNEEVFAVLKILLESRAFTKQELYPILDKLIECCVPKENKRRVTELIGNERLHYMEPQHKTVVLAKMWELAGAVKECRLVRMLYKRAGQESAAERLVKPVGIMFSEFYFYLVAFIEPEAGKRLNLAVENDPFPTIYRIDRIEDFTVTDEHFSIPYQKRFEEGEFRKRVQFMYGGRLQKIKFVYKGPSVEAVLDRLPTAKILRQDNKGFLISAEVFGRGVEMWLRSQGEMVELLESKEVALS